MAATREAARLTEAHRLAQGRVSAATVRRMLSVWPLLRVEDLDASFPGWLAAVVPVVRAGKTTSARMAANYLATFRALELGVDAAPAAPVVADEVDPAAVSASMLVTGPARIRAASARGVPIARAVVLAQTASARAAARHSLAGGRDTIEQTVAADRQALGVARSTSGSPCHFCAMLASRGPVYKSEATAGLRPHDGCHCQPEPVYRRDAAWPAGAQRYRELWDETTAGLSGNDAVNAFRRALTAA